MLTRVSNRVLAHNNASAISQSQFLTSIKIMYYRLIAFAYGSAGRCADLTMVNSTWTMNHIAQLWLGTQHSLNEEHRVAANIALVYPPCDLDSLVEASAMIKEVQRRPNIISVAQFRPEKDHPLQIRAFAKFISDHAELEDLPVEIGPKLVLIGGCRNDEDRSRVASYKQLAKDLAIDDRVEFIVNASVESVRDHLLHGSIAIHTMWNEHFGISVAEYLAAGLITVAHDSAGPKMDIVRPVDGQPSGLLAATENDYAEQLWKAWQIVKSDDVDQWRNRARAAVRHRFGEKEFIRHWQALVLAMNNHQQ